MTSSFLPPKSSLNVLPLTITYIQQITDKIDKYHEPHLENLDHAIMKYVQTRNEQKKPVLQSLEDETLSVENLNVGNLNVLHNETECAYMKLENMMSQFCSLKESIQEANNRCISYFLFGDEYNEIGFMLDVCKDLIFELSKYRDVQSFVNKIQQYRKQNKNLQRDHNLLVDIEQHIMKMDDVISDEEEEHLSYDKSYSKSQMLLDFIK